MSSLVSRPCERHVDKEGSHAAKTQYTRHISYDPVVHILSAPFGCMS